MEMQMTNEERYNWAKDICKHTFANERIMEAREAFAALGDYEDSRKCLEKCDQYLAFRCGNKVTYGTKDGEPIRWTVMAEAGRNRLLFADYPVAYMPYHVDRDHTNWVACSLRRWLNKDFMEQCFSMHERMNILLTRVDNDQDKRWSVENGPATRDKAYVFTKAELEDYLPTPEARTCGEWYWLRGHGSNLLSPMAVYEDGTIYDYGINKNSENVGVRPCIWVRCSVL